MAILGTPVATDGATVVGDGTSGSPLAAVGGSTGAGNSDGVTLQGTGLVVNPYAIKSVQHDGTLTGDGTVAVPLGVDASALAGDVAIATSGSQLAGDGTTGTPLHVVGGTVAVTTSGSELAGDGTSGSPLHVVPAALAGEVAVDTDGSTISGDGTFATPLAVIPTGLANQVPVLTDGVTAAGTGVTGNPISVIASAGTTIYFNVKAYGATGNGSTDDTTAIRSAIAAAAAVGGGTVYFPDGTYVISEHSTTLQCLSLPANVSLLGQSRAGAILFMANAQRENVRMIYCVAGAADLTISYLTLNGNAGGQSGPNSFHRDEIFLDNTARITITEVTCTNGFASGIIVWQNSIDTLIEHCYIHNNVWQGIAWGDAGGQQRSTVRDCYVIGNAGGIHFEVSVAASDMLIEHCTMDATVGNASLNLVGGGGGTDATKLLNNVSVLACTINGAVNVASATNIYVGGGTVITCNDSAPTPQPAIKVAGQVTNCTFQGCEIALTAGGTAGQAVWFAGNANANTVNINLLDCKVNVATNADAVTLQSIPSARVERCTLVGNATATGYGVDLNAKTIGSDRLIVRDNTIIDFPIGIVAQAGSGTFHTADVTITGNDFKSSALSMTACMSLDLDNRHTIQQATVFGNSPGSAIPMFATYPNVPMLVGGNRGNGGQYNGAGAPTLTETTGATYVQRDAANASLVNWSNFGGAWASIAVP